MAENPPEGDFEMTVFEIERGEKVTIYRVNSGNNCYTEIAITKKRFRAERRNPFTFCDSFGFDGSAGAVKNPVKALLKLRRSFREKVRGEYWKDRD